MYEYIRGLHQQFFKEPDFPELRQELHELRRELTEDRPREERRKLLKLVDLEAELRDEICQYARLGNNSAYCSGN